MLGFGAWAALWFFLLVYRYPYVILTPGGAEDVSKKLSVKGTKEFVSKGNILWATVGIKGSPSGLDMLREVFKDDEDRLTNKQFYGDTSQKDQATQSKAEMEDAKLVATIVAARKLGYTTSAGGAEIVELTPKFPSAGVLKVGDIIEQADGKPICIQNDFAEIVRKKLKNAPISLVVRHPGAKKGEPETRRTVNVNTKFVPELNRSLLGVLLAPAKDRPCKPSFDLTINSGRVGGPSAGLAMTLSILDRLTPGELTGGVKVAVTGTIEADGSVGIIGGVRQKTAAVRSAGAKLFIVPFDEVAQAKPHAGSMQVVGVHNVDEALAALRKIGGDPLPEPREAGAAG